MNVDLDAIAWPAERLGDALTALAHDSGLSRRAVTAPRASGASLADPDVHRIWIEQAAEYLGVEAEHVVVRYREVPDMLRVASPALMRLPKSARGLGATKPEPGASSDTPGPRFVALIGRVGRNITLLRPDGSRARLDVEVLADLLRSPAETRARPQIERIIELAAVQGRRKEHVRRALLHENVGGLLVGGVWLLRSPPGTSPLKQASEAHLPRHMRVVIAAQAASSALLGLAWWTIGQGALEDHLDRGYLLAWALLLLTAVPLRLLTAWSTGLFAINAGGLLKRRLLAGALALEPEEVRHEGTGSFLGRVIESTAVESLALGAGLLGLSAVISLLMASAVLARGAAGALHVPLLAAWTLVSIALVVRYYHRLRRWTDARLALTHDLVERMVGHRTRLAQEPRERWHDGEDQALARYIADAEAMDQKQAAITAILPRGWLIVGVLGLAPAFIAGGVSPASLAVSLGGVLLANTALQSLVGGLSSLAGAAIAWRRVAPLFQAAAREGFAPPPAPPRDAQQLAPGRTLLEAQALVFRHHDRGAPVLRGATLKIAAGDQVLLEGPSGGGKSTLGSLLAGLRAPESGLLLLEGLDRRVMGARAWRRRVISVPQFHENHVLQSSLAFNLLMGRRWPPEPADLAEAETVCRELGLGELLDRMPAGLSQTVGETGWQLSHGEKSRLYIARALLQGGDMLLLDESFAALDPETLGLALRCVLARTPTVLVIAHP